VITGMADAVVARSRAVRLVGHSVQAAPAGDPWFRPPDPSYGPISTALQAVAVPPSAR
jgi:hypothetical protein